MALLVLIPFLLAVGQAGAEVDAEAKSGVTALWLASGEGRKDVLKELLKSGASANNSRSDGITALMGAAAGGHGEVVNMLLKAGKGSVDLHARLHLASEEKMQGVSWMTQTNSKGFLFPLPGSEPVFSPTPFVGRQQFRSVVVGGM